MKIDWHILGPGAMGCLWGVYLKSQQQSIGFISRSEPHSNTVLLQKTGLEGEASMEVPIATVASLSAPIERLLLCTKSYDGITAFENVQHLLTPNAQVVLLHNGFNTQQSLASTYPQHRLYALVTSVGSFLRSPYQVVHAGQGDSFIGPLTKTAAEHPILEFPLNTQWEPNIHQRLIDKLCVNAVINPLSVYYQCQNGDLLSGEAWSTFQALAKEVDQVIHSLGYKPSQPALKLAMPVAEKTANNYSSSYQDVKHQRRTELSEFTGFLYRKGKSFNLDLPQHETLIQAFKHQFQLESLDHFP